MPVDRRDRVSIVEYLDLPSMEKGHAMDVLPLDELRTVDALAHVVRAFEDEAIAHSEGTIDPARDVATMETEFLLSDHTIAERRVEKLDQLVRKTNRDDHRKDLELMRKVLAELERGSSGAVRRRRPVGQRLLDHSIPTALRTRDMVRFAIARALSAPS